MYKFNDQFFGIDQSQVVAPPLIEEPGNLEDFDITAPDNTPLDQFTPPAMEYTYPDGQSLMDMDLTPRINYNDDFAGELSGGYVDPAIISSSSGSGEQVAPIAIPVDPVLLGAQPKQNGRYLNAILNSFNSPVVPLRVIDVVEYPFEQKLQSALERELEREKDRELVQALQNDAAPPAPMQTARQLSPAKKSGNKRPDNIRNFNAADFYEPLQSRPVSWGSINPETGDQLFQYTEHGELNPLHSFSVAQISEYLSKHPLHNVSGAHDTKKSGIILWVQTVPADSGRRYPEKQSDKCRFAQCPDPYHTIRKGDFRVAFDEQHWLKRNTDPFHNAGYVHLYCLEKFFDFPQICKDFNVRPDTRVLREGKNKMAITRDHPTMEDVVLEFIAGCVPWVQFGQRPQEYYQHTLCSRLTDEHLVRQPKHLQNIRDKRGGNSIDVHKNNLDLCVDNARLLKERKAHLSKTEPKPNAQKRKAQAMEDEDSGLDEQILWSNVESTGSSPRPANRRRSPRSSQAPEKPWTDGFHTPGLPF
jgi:hypothetical protein